MAKVGSSGRCKVQGYLWGKKKDLTWEGTAKPVSIAAVHCRRQASTEVLAVLISPCCQPEWSIGHFCTGETAFSTLSISSLKSTDLTT